MVLTVQVKVMSKGQFNGGVNNVTPSYYKVTANIVVIVYPTNDKSVVRTDKVLAVLSTTR